jgi:DNA-binding transcriptional regulator LsrR (DeoR family)
MKQTNNRAQKSAKRGRRKTTPKVLLGQKDILAKATRLYHHQKLTQQQITDKPGLSPPTVVRLLRQALDQGIVTVSLRLDVLRQVELSAQLAKRLD